jgi:hypothetical protein
MRGFAADAGRVEARVAATNAAAIVKMRARGRVCFPRYIAGEYVL